MGTVIVSTILKRVDQLDRDTACQGTDRCLALTHVMYHRHSAVRACVDPMCGPKPYMTSASTLS